MQAYFDNSATTQVSDAAARKIQTMLCTLYGNPSSLHEMGIQAEQEMKKARAALAKALGCSPSEILFCSGGTEANNTAVFGAVQKMRRFGNRIVTTAVEHASVIEPMKMLQKQGFEVIFLKPGEDGKITHEQVFAAVDSQTIFVSVMLCNNETGAVFPVNVVRDAVEAAGAKALIHTDAVQAFLKMPWKINDLQVDLLSVSAHKLHGPKGIGALYVKKGVQIPPLLFGGGQENGRRAGTESTPLIAGFGAAVEEILKADDFSRIKSMHGKIIKGLQSMPDVVVNSPPDALPYIMNFSVPGIRSETMLHFLEQSGVYVSSGSACAGNKRSHVLLAQGLSPERIDSSIRVSLSRMNTSEQCDLLLGAVKKAIETLLRS